MPLLPSPFSVQPIFRGLPDLPAIAELRQHQQWVAWRYEHRNGADKKPTKPPVNARTGGGASHSNPATWAPYEAAERRAFDDMLPGVGFVLAKDDGYTGIDLDNCRDPKTGEIAAWSRSILDLAETYAEVSPSGTGIRIIARGKVDKTIKCDPASVEIYGSARYLTITGNHIEGTPVEIGPAPKTLAALQDRVDEFKKPREAAVASWPAVANTRASNFFRAVNDRALKHLPAWVPDLFGPAAQLQFGTGAYRISSRTLGRDLEEDLSISPLGIKDWGVHDMGDPREGGRTAIDLAIEYGGGVDARDAAFWLCDQMRVRPEDLGWGADLDPIAAESQKALAAQIAVEPEPDRKALDTSEMEDLWFDGSPYDPEAIGGLLGEVAAHILETALFPVPDFAALAAMTFGSALYGRRWVEPITGGGLNVYTIATAPTGWGKDHPLQEPRQIAYKCEMVQLLGPDEFKSDAGIEKTLRRCPIRACFMDEIGIVLQANSDRNASSWERKVRKALLQVYSASKGMWTGSQAAGDDSDKGSEPIHKPILSIYGTSTPEELYQGLNEKNIRDGLFGRLIFASPEEKPERQKISTSGRYDAIREAVDEVRCFVPEEVPERERSLYHANMRNSLTPPFQIRVPAAADAYAAIEMILEWQRDLVEKEDDLSKIANRAAENVGKLATMRALSRDHKCPEMVLGDVKWAWSIIDRSLHVIARDIERHMVGSEYEGLVKAIKRHLEDAGKGGMALNRLNMARGVGKFHARDKEAAIKELRRSGEVIERISNRGVRLWLARFKAD